MKVIKSKFSKKEQEKLLECDLKGCQKCGRILNLKYGFRFRPYRKTPYHSPCNYCEYVDAFKKKCNEYKGSSKIPDSYEEWFFKYSKKMRVKKFFNKIGISSEERRAYSKAMFQYNTTPEETHELLKGDKVCAISGRPLNILSKGTDEELHIDHCHQTGKIRGLLYRRFNIGLGLFEDNPDLLRAAADYLEKHKDEATN